MIEPAFLLHEGDQLVADLAVVERVRSFGSEGLVALREIRPLQHVARSRRIVVDQKFLGPAFVDADFRNVPLDVEIRFRVERPAVLGISDGILPELGPGTVAAFLVDGLPAFQRAGHRRRDRTAKLLRHIEFLRIGRGRRDAVIVDRRQLLLLRLPEQRIA